VSNEKGTDFFFIRRPTAEGAAQTIAELIMRRLPGYLKDCDVFQDIQVLTPMRKSFIGVANLNEELQRCMNPPSPEKREKEFHSVVFREGDKVMQIRNNYNIAWNELNGQGHILGQGLGVFNGDEGLIRSINDEEEYVDVLFDGNRLVRYSFNQLDDLSLSYAVTIHKSQGSEYKAVIIPILSGPPMLMNRNLLYTAVTRAKKMVVIVGLQEMVRRMVNNNRQVDRYTALAERLRRILQML
jgi:exodeoxyribonuclease V alpha subunit